MWASQDGAVIDNGDGTITDRKNHLMWEREVKQYSVSWDMAAEYAENLDLAGYSDWRLPTPDELSALYESSIACAWQSVPLIRTAITLWSSEQAEPASAVSVNICTGKARTSEQDEGGAVSPSVLAVREAK